MKAKYKHLHFGRPIEKTVKVGKNNTVTVTYTPNALFVLFFLCFIEILLLIF